MNDEIKITIRQICDKMNAHTKCVEHGCYNCPVEKLNKQLNLKEKEKEQH